MGNSKTKHSYGITPSTPTKHEEDDVAYDPRSPSSRTPVSQMVKERKATVVEFNLDGPETPGRETDYDPRSPSSRTPVAQLVRERKLTAVEFDLSGEENVEIVPNVTSAPVQDLKMTAIRNAHRKAVGSQTPSR
jgi:hypothetical protein